MRRRIKQVLSYAISACFRATLGMRTGLNRLFAHSRLAASLVYPLPGSVVLMGGVRVFGSGHMQIGENALFYPGVYLETQLPGEVVIGRSVVLSSGVHVVSMARVEIGDGSMVGEYTSLRDANHARLPGSPIRDSGYTAAPIVIGKNVWIGRGVTVLGGVTIGDNATVGANAVVTKNVAAGEVVAGVPARPLQNTGGRETSALKPAGLREQPTS